MKEFYSKHEIAALIGCNPEEVPSLIEEGIIPRPSHQIGRGTRFCLWSEQVVKKWLNNAKTQTPIPAHFEVIRPSNQQEKNCNPYDEIKRFLKSRRITQTFCAKAIGRSKASLNSIFCGQLSISTDTANKIIAFLSEQGMQPTFSATQLISFSRKKYKETFRPNDYGKKVLRALKETQKTRIELAKFLGYPRASSFTRNLVSGRSKSKRELVSKFFKNHNYDLENEVWLTQKPAEEKPVQTAIPVLQIQEIPKQTGKILDTDDQELLQEAIANFYNQIDMEAREFRATGQTVEAIKKETFRDRMDKLINKLDKILAL